MPAGYGCAAINVTVSTVADVRSLVVGNVPLNDPGSLSQEDYAAVMAFLLQVTSAHRGIYSMASDRVEALANLLHQAGEVHHVYFADVDGNDDDWASFYSEWLLSRTNLPQILARRPVRSGLTCDLVQLDENFAASGSDEPWSAAYARRLIEKYGERT